MREDGEAVAEDDDHKKSKGEVRRVWLETGAEDQVFSVDALGDEGAAEPDVSDDCDEGERRR